MKIHRFTIGIAFNEKLFRLNSLSGQLADSIFSFIKTNDDLGANFFKSVEVNSSIDRLSVNFIIKKLKN